MAADYAILVGISHYPNPGFSDLNGPLNDVALMEAWLRSPEGGGIIDTPQAPRIMKLATPRPYPERFAPEEAPPTQKEFELQFRRFIKSLEGGQARRLYLFFSGHGFSARQWLDANAAIYTADADNDWPMNIFGTWYAQMALRKGWFQEVVLVMDCCRDAEINRKPATPPIDESFDEGVAAQGKLLAFYAAPFGGKAQERPIAQANNRIHGLLTYALVNALINSPADSSGALTGTQIKHFITDTWSSLYGADAPDLPKIQPPDGPDIVFNTAPTARDFAQRIRLAPQPRTPARVVVSGAHFEPLFTCELDPGGASQIVLPNGDARPLPFDGESFTLVLPAGLYCCEIEGSAPPRTTSLIVRGDGDAQL